MNERTGSGGRDVSSESILDRMRSAVSVELYMILMCLASNMNYPSQQVTILYKYMKQRGVRENDSKVAKHAPVLV